MIRATDENYNLILLFEIISVMLRLHGCDTKEIGCVTGG